jgi:hypothetical protein
LGIFSLWIGAAVMAVKAGELPRIPGVAGWFSSSGWGYVPFIFATVYLCIALHRAMGVRKANELDEAAIGDIVAEQASRRRLIADGRKLVSAFNQQNDEGSLLPFLSKQQEWPAICARLDSRVVADIRNGRLLVFTDGSVKDGKVLLLMRELERLEREWNLI